MATVTCKMGLANMVTQLRLVLMHAAHTATLHFKTTVGVCAPMSTAQSHNTGRFQIINVEILALESQVAAVVLDGAMQCTASLPEPILIMWAVSLTIAIVTCRMGLEHMATHQQVVRRHVAHTVFLPYKTMAGVCAETPTAQSRNTVRLMTVNVETLVLVRQVDIVVLDGAMRYILMASHSVGGECLCATKH